MKRGNAAAIADAAAQAGAAAPGATPPIPGALYTFMPGHGFVLVGDGSHAASAVPPQVGVPVSLPYGVGGGYGNGGEGQVSRLRSAAVGAVRSSASYLSSLWVPSRGYASVPATVDGSEDQGQGAQAHGHAPAFVEHPSSATQNGAPPPAPGSAAAYGGFQHQQGEGPAGYPFRYVG